MVFGIIVLVEFFNMSGVMTKLPLGVVHVVDSCSVKAKVHQAGKGLDLLKVAKVKLYLLVI